MTEIKIDKKYYLGKDILDAILAHMDTVAALPAADVVEVVRCKDCTVPHNHWTGCPRMNGTIMRPDDYCSYGERKEVLNG